MKYKEYEIDDKKVRFEEGVAVLPLPDGSIVCIPEEDATQEELKLIQAIKEVQV